MSGVACHGMNVGLGVLEPIVPSPVLPCDDGHCRRMWADRQTWRITGEEQGSRWDWSGRRRDCSFYFHSVDRHTLGLVAWRARINYPVREQNRPYARDLDVSIALYL